MNNIKFSSFLNEEESNNEILEKLSALEHDQWMNWAKTILDQEEISEDRAKRWKGCFIPYEEFQKKWKNMIENMQERF